MELPLGGPALRHYTQSRPRPHRQKLNYRPSRPQETIIESDNEVLELMGRVDEGVEEFFTKRVLPTDALKKQDEESITVHEVAPASSVPCPPPTKTLRRKLGDFFTLKKRRGLKSETSHEGRPKKASIADLIRPLREVARAEKEKDKDRVKEHDKENEKEKAKEHPNAAGESAVQETPVSGAPPLRAEAVPPRRALREGKSQSLILLSGSAAAGTTNARNTAKKQFEGQHSFEQKLHLMLQRIGVSKAQPGETQNQEGEMKKAESEGTIIDSKPEPPPTFTKPRTMSASSDTRHQIRPSVSAHESAGKPALLPKPVIKPGPTSGRNTPENELAQIQEGETNTPTKLSPTAAPSTPAAHALTATTTPTVPTISNSVPDSTNFTISPSSTVPSSDTDICTDSVNPTAAATTSTNVTEPDSKPSIPETTTTELPTATFLTAHTSSTTPTEPPTTVSVTSTSSESITLSLSVTSNSATITTPSITTSETVSAPSNKSPVSTASTHLSTESAFPEPDGILSFAAAAPDAAISVITTSSSSSSPSTSTSDMPSGLSTTANSVPEAGDESTSVTSACSVTLVSSVTKTTSPPPNSSDTITTPVTPDGPITTSSSSALPPTSSISSTTTTTSPTSTDCMNSMTPSTMTHPGTSSPADISAPSTSSSETNPTDTTTTTTTSLNCTDTTTTTTTTSLNRTDTTTTTTTTSLNCTDTTTTTSSPAAAAISSPLLTDSDLPYTNNISTDLTPTISDIPTTANSSATCHHLTSPAPSNDSPGQDNDLQTSPEERSSVVPTAKSTADVELEMVQKSKQTETDESKKVVDGGKESEIKNEKPAPVNSDEIKEKAQERSMKPEEDTVKTEMGIAEPTSGKDGALHSEGDEEVVGGQKQDETKSVGEK